MISQNSPVLNSPTAPIDERGSRRPLQSPSATVRVGVIGYGYWGPNIARNIHGLDNCELAAICDRSPAALQRAQRAYPGVSLTTELSEVLTSPDIDAVAVITPVWTHFELAKAALENGKHVFVEKPFTSTSRRRRS